MKVTIVGAGLGGLMLARVLYRNGVEAEIYEAAAGPAAGPCDGPVGLPVETGQAALRAAGLYGHLPAITVDGGDETRILDRHGTGSAGERRGMPAVHHGDLRDLLLASLPDDTVRWGRRVVEARAGGEIVVGRGRVHRTEVLVGADGPRSVVRPLLSDATAGYTGISVAEVRVRHARRHHPELAELVGGGRMVAFDDGTGLIAHREPDDELCVRAAVRVPPEAAPATLDALLGHFTGWHPDLRRLLTASAGDPVVRPVHGLPAGIRWPRVPGVTLVGGAAYPASPFTDDGANLALLDAAELGCAIAECPGEPERALAVYEAAMFERAAAASRRPVEHLGLTPVPG